MKRRSDEWFREYGWILAIGIAVCAIILDR